MITYVVHGYQSGMKYAQEHAKDIKIHKFNGAVKMTENHSINARC